MLLVDKYSPKSLDDIIGNKSIVDIIKNMNENAPHLLFYGPPGTGKTTISHILLKNYNNFIELNASDERGIDVIRNKIKSFCSSYSNKKLVILDECDNLTSAAQQALRRLMEASSTKFILICNEISKVIEPIQSRCAVLNFQRISHSEFTKHVKEIILKEVKYFNKNNSQVVEDNKSNIKNVDEIVETIVDLSSGDLRSCLNIIQGISNIENIDSDFIYKISGKPNKKKLIKIFNLIKKDKNLLIKEFEELYLNKYEDIDLISGFFNIAKDLDSYESMKIIGEYQLRASEGKSSKLQFYSMFNELSLI